MGADHAKSRNPLGRTLCLRLEEMAGVGVFLLASALFVFMAFATALNLVFRLNSVATTLDWWPDAAVLLILAAVTVLSVWLSQLRTAWPALVTCGLLVVGASLASVLVLKPEWVSDFWTMWARATEFATTEFVLRDIYDQRIQLLLVPAVRAFGPHEWAVVLLNALCLFSVLALGSVWVRRVAGNRAALLFCLAFASVPEILLALGIPTHDIWALPFVAATAVAMQQSLQASRWKGTAMLWALAASLGMVLLQVQREIGHVAFLAGFLTYCVVAATGHRHPRANGMEPPATNHRSAAMTALSCAAVLAVAYPLGMAMATGGGLFTDGPGYRDLVHVRVGGIVPSTSRGTYGDARGFADNFLAQLEPDARAELARDVALSDAAMQPQRRIPNAIHRARTLAYLGSQWEFYLYGLHSERPALSRWVPAITGWHAAVFSLLSVVALVSVIRSGLLRHYLFPVLFSSILIAGLVLVGEVQPRYLMPLWYTGALLIAALAVRLRPVRLRGRLWPVVHLSILAASAFGLWKAFDTSYTQDDGRILEWSLRGDSAHVPPRGAAFAALVGDERWNAMGALGFTMQLEASEAAIAIQAADSTLCVAQEGRLEFFYYMPYHSEHAIDYFQLSLLVDGVPQWTVGLPSTPGAQHAAVDLPAQGCMDLSFELSTEKGLPDVSWVNASRTDIYFPRFVGRQAD